MAVMLFVMWLGFMGFFYLKADEITKDPCSICSNRFDDTISCTTHEGVAPITKKWYPNWTVTDNSKEVVKEVYKEIDESMNHSFLDPSINLSE